MKITFDNWNQNQNVEKGTITQSTFSHYRETTNGAYSLDISGTVMDNNAYADHGRSAKEVMQEFGTQLDNLAVKQNYMTVMSNIMSTEDFNKMMEDGFDPSKLDPEQVVTIVDHIKAEMAKSGEVVAGYNDDLSKEQLTQILGSASLAKEVEQSFQNADMPISEENITSVRETLDKASQITGLDDAGKKYMLENRLEPTVENIYRASFSAQGDGNKQSKGYFSQEMPGYYAKKAEVVDWQAMEPQIEKSIEKMNLKNPEKEDCMEQAKWLISKGLPVTEDSMQRLQELEAISFPLDNEEVIKAGINALVKGLSPEEGKLTDEIGSVYERANQHIEDANSITKEAVMETVSQEKVVNLKNLTETQKQIEAGEIAKERVAQLTSMIHMETEVSVKYVHAARTLAEVQLRMTIDANIRLLKSDYSIDTMPLTELVEALKEQEEKLAVSFFGEENSQQISEKTALYKETDSILKEIPFLPAAVIGRIMATAETNLTTVHTQGVALRAQYQAAGISYEALMTAPRADLGDSIKKAFANVDDILQDMGQELSEDNRKAVRILGYNNTEITEETLSEVKETYLQVENVVKAMTPQRTLSLIREGVNPLTMSLDELEAYLNNMEQSPQSEADKYTRFLYELEKSGQITESERSAYIGIYRAFHQIEKADGAAIGSLLNQGGDLTLGNLLTAARNRKVGKMDYSIDDDFGLLTGVEAKGTSISEQIESGIAKARQAMAEDAKQMWDAAANAGKDVFEMLDNLEMTLSPENVFAAKELFANKGKLSGQVKDFAKRLDAGNTVNTTESGPTILEAALDESAKTVIDKFTDFESAQKAMETWENNVETILQNTTNHLAETTMDMKAVSLCFKQMSLISSMRKQENYEVPMEINGEMTSVNLVLIHGTEEKGTVNITMQTENFGKAGVRFRISQNTVESYFVADSEMGKERLQAVGSFVLERLQNKGLEIGETNYVNSYSQGRKELNLLTFSQTDVDNNSKSVATKQLYEVAKVFLTGLQQAFN